MAAIFFYLCRSPNAYSTVCAEIRSTFAKTSPSEIKIGPLLNSCTYLRACIDESLRLSPPAGSALWREVLPGGIMVDGTTIPAGCDIGTGIYSIHHKSSCFHDPFAFVPERWLAGHVSNESIKLAHDAFVPFSMGPRSCVGKGLAIAEMMLLLAVVLMKFDFESAPGALGRVGEGAPELGKGRQVVEEFQTHEHVTMMKDGPYVQFKALEVTPS